MKRYEKDVLQNNKESINIAEVPGLLKITTVKPNEKKEKIHVTQVHGSMERKVF